MSLHLYVNRSSRERLSRMKINPKATYMSQNTSRNAKALFSPRTFLRSHNVRSIAEVGMPALSLACDPKLGKTNRVWWGCLWLVCVICCVIQCTNCIIYFVSSPTNVDVKHQKTNKMDVPYVTLCPVDPGFRNPALSPLLLKERFGDVPSSINAYDLLQKHNITISELWNISSFALTNVSWGLNSVSSLTEGFKLISENVEHHTLLTVHGTCLLFKTKKSVNCMGTQSGLNVLGYGKNPYEKKSFSYFMGVVHSALAVPFIQYFGTIQTGFYITYEQLTTVALRVQKVIRVNTRQNPCQPEKEYENCLVRCLENNIISAAKSTLCRLPFMESMPSSIPNCVTADDFANVYVATEAGLRVTNAKSCNCIRPCRIFEYWEEYFLKDSINYGLFDFWVIMPHCDIEVFEEVLNYGYMAFISDIGGAIGLLLGMSILSIIELLEVIFWKIALCKHFTVN